MSLELVRDDEQLVIQGDGWKWIYRRVPAAAYRQIQRRHTNRKNEINGNLVARDTIIYATLGWEGFTENGVEVPYSAAVVEKVVDSLPQSIGLQFFEAAWSEDADRVAGELKNSPTTHDSNPTTTG